MAPPGQLAPQQRQRLLRDGYLLVPGLLDPADLARIATQMAGHVRETVAAWAEEPSLDTHGGAVMTNFDLDDPGLAPCCQHPLVLDAAATVLAEGWHLQALGLRAPIPGSGEQGLHRDFGERDPGTACRALSAMWCISEFTRDSGPLRVIPGSHLVSEPPIDIEHGYATGMGPHPGGMVKILGPAGSLILFNGADLWHSGTFNYTPAARMALTAVYAPGPPWPPDV